MSISTGCPYECRCGLAVLRQIGFNRARGLVASSEVSPVLTCRVEGDAVSVGCSHRGGRVDSLLGRDYIGRGRRPAALGKGGGD